MKNLIEAINKVYAQVGYVQKKGTMQGPASYKYAKEADFIEAIRPHLIDNGLVITPYIVSNMTSEQYLNKSGTPTNRVVATFNFRIIHTSGEEMIVTAIGEGVDTGDKASYKAMTGALKYALRQSFLIETGDDPDETDSAHFERAAPVKETPPKVKAWAEASLAYLAACFPPDIDAFVNEQDNKTKLSWIKDNDKKLWDEFTTIGVKL